MGDIVNLRQVRKRAARTDREAEATTNRAKFGRTKAERALQQSEAEKLRKTLDGAERED
jgi:ribosomal protein S2